MEKRWQTGNALIVLAAVLAFSGVARAQAQQELCEVAGSVVRAGDSQPLRSAVVTLIVTGRRGEPISVRTDANGRFAFSKVVAGTYRLSVERAGYTRQEYGQRLPGRRGVALNLSPGQRATDLLFRLIPAGVVTGHVYDETGEPVVGASVYVLRRTYRSGEPALEPSSGDNSDDRGEYRIFNLAPGKYIVSASPSGGFGVRRRGAESGDETYVPTYYPGVTDPDRAVPLEVTGGQEVSRIDLTLIPQSTVSVRGRVLGMGGAKGATQVVLMPRSGRMGPRGRMREERIGEDGSFELRGVAPGSYIVAALQFDESSSSYAREAIEVGDSDINGLSLALVPTGIVTGKISVESGALPEGRIFVNLRPEDALSRGGSARALPDGTFEVRNVAMGQYEVMVSAIPADFYVKSVKIGNEEFVDRGLLLSRETSRVDIVLSPSGGRVEGQVLTDENLPAIGVTVVLVPPKEARGVRARYRTTTTDAMGQFVIRGIRPGEYTLFAWDSDEGEVWMDPDFLSRFDDKAHKVRLFEGAAQSAQLTLLPSN